MSTDPPTPLSFAQERLWFLDRLEPGRPTYNLPAMSFRMRGSLNGAALRRALDELARRHPALRTTFPEVDGRPVQAVAPPAPFPLPEADLRALPAHRREAEARAQVQGVMWRPFDLARGPLSRALLLRLSRSEHLFALAQHHAVSDGASVDVLRRELGALYAGFARGEAAALPEPATTPIEFARGQRGHLQGETLDALLGWWQERLGGSLPLLELPADHPRPAALSFRGGRVGRPLGPEMAEAVRRLGSAGRATPFMVLLAAFLALLHRVTGQTDLLVGFPAAGRERPELAGVVGFFVNTLVLRAGVADDPTFLDLLERTREGVLQAVRHGDLPFERLVEELQPGRALSHNPLVQVLFLYQQADGGDLRLPGLTLTPEPPGSVGAAKFDLTLTIDETPDGLHATFEYSRDLFEPSTARRLLAHFLRLLEGALARPETRLSALPLLGGPERHQLLLEWNDTRRRDPGDLVHALVLARARQTPEAPALVSPGGGAVTYGGLAAWAGGIARRLAALGVGPDSRVGVCMERSPGLIAALLGVLAAGGAYVPLDPAQPRERLLAMLRASGARALLAPDSLRIEGFDGAVLSPSGLEAAAPPEVAGVTPESLAYVIFTSGSTGEPKGVAVPHRAVVRLVRDAGYAEMGPEEVFLQLSPVSFDASTFEIWGCLANGGRLVIPPPGLPSLAELGGLLRGAGVTTLWLTAGLFHSMVDEGLEGLAGVRQLLAGGDVLSPAHVRRALAALPGVRLIDGYGPTESTTFACCHGMTALSPPPDGPVPIGRPIGNTRAYVLDRAGNPLPVGVAGDLLLGGDGLARGYEGDPALTAGRFVPSPFAGPGERLYRTGDRARWRPDGRLEFLGRSDEQVKIRGFRVEPGEIEAALAGHPAVAEAAVVAVGEGAHARRLVAFAAPRPGSAADPREIRDWLKRRLPLYMVPAAVVIVDALPLTPHGKVDRRELARRAAEAGRREPGGEAAALRTDLERRLAEVWAGLLQIPAVGVHDNFFDLGGDSLLAIQLVARAGRAGIPLTLRQLFNHQTVAELAAAVAVAPAVQAEQGWVTGPVPMTPGQVWFFDRIAEHLKAPHQFSTKGLFEIRGPASPAAVARAVARAVVRILFQHDALRLRVVEREDGTWEQIGAGPEAVADSWAHLDLAALPASARDGAVVDAARQLLRRRELEGPLSRFVLFGLGGERPARLFVLLHHLVSDAASWRILREDLETVLGQALRGEEPDLPPKTTSFRAWALRQAELARSEEVRRQVDFWLALRGQTLPADFPGGEAGTGAVATVSAALGEEETQALLQNPRVRLTDVLLTAVVRAFTRWTGSPSLLIRYSLHGRDPVFDDVDLSRTIGWIATTAPVPLDLAGTETPAEALAAIAGQIERVPLRGLGYGLLRYMSGDAGIAARMETVVAAPAATFNFLGRFDGGAAGPGLLAEVPLEVEPRPGIPRRDAQLRINAGVAGPPARLVVGWEYGRDFYHRETIERLAEGCLEELRRVIAEAWQEPPRLR